MDQRSAREILAGYPHVWLSDESARFRARERLA